MKKFKMLLGAAIALAMAALVAACGGSNPAQYLALGDSVAYGEYASAPEKYGYVALFREFYRKDHDGSERFVNLAVPGEKSATFLNEQWAKAAIQDPDSDTTVVTVTIGANDFLPILREPPCSTGPGTPACLQTVGQAIQAFGANFQTIMSNLKTEMDQEPGESKQILVTTYYNPYDGTDNPFEQAVDLALWGADGKVDCGAASNPLNVGVNDIVTCQAMAAGAIPVDLYPLFDGKGATLTFINQNNVHPNNAGYKAIADAVVAAYKAQN